MLQLMILCSICAMDGLHPDEAAVVRGSQMDPDAVLQMSPEALQQQFNAYVPPPCTLEIELVQDRVVPTPAGDVPCRFYHPNTETVLPLLIWFHGGGWVLGTLDQTDAICRLIAHRGQCAVLSVDYPLAPQHPFPAAVDACEFVTRWALSQSDALHIHPDQVAVGGASAGGNLAAVTAAAVGGALQAQFLVYPAVDALAETASRRDLARGYILHTDHMNWFYDAYVPNRSQWSDPRVSPLRAASHAHLPRTIVLTAQFDVLRDEAVQYALALSQAGVPVDLLMAPGMLHGFASRWSRSAVCRAELERAVDLLADVLHGERVHVADMLDLDQDGLIGPFEAADAVGLMLHEDEAEGVSVDALQTAARLTAAWDRVEIDQMWADLNTNQDAWLDMSELSEDLVPLAVELDRNQDGRLSQSEAMAVRSLEAPLFVHMEVASILAMYDTDGDDVITLMEAKQFGDAELVDEADNNGDEVVSRQELLDAFADWNAPLWFEVEGNQAVAYGTIDSSTPSRVMQLLINHPEVETIVLQEVPGSVDDESNMRAGRLIRHHGLSTHVPADGEIASGGVDLFLAGAHRSIEPGARLGVHSWGGVGEAGDALDRSDEAHDLYLEYGRDMGIPDAFYWFTIEAAPPDDIHWMTSEEIDRYQLAEPRMDTAPQMLEHSSDQSFGVEPIDPDDHALRREGFIKETRVMAPNGKAIRIVAQAGVPNIAVARARNLLQFFLTDVPGSRFGADKSAVANAMADNGAMLMMPRGAHEPGNEPNVEAQPLFQDETPIDGSRWYVLNDWDHRDAAFEEIFHLVHDAGIGTWLPGALPAYQEALDHEARAAIKDGRWGIRIDPEVTDWLEELDAEDSLAQEYIASVIDTYYGLWAAFDERPGGMWGIYIAKTREQLGELDPQGKALVEAFLPPMMVGYEALVDPSFRDQFSLEFMPSRPYTHKSRYYVDATLTGDLDSGLIGNAANNTLRGNRGNNTIQGGLGRDVYVLSGKMMEYEVRYEDGWLRVSDSVEGRDGHDRLQGVEVLRFSDTQVEAPS